jgi:hypothetical protein
MPDFYRAMRKPGSCKFGLAVFQVKRRDATGNVSRETAAPIK